MKSFKLFLKENKEKAIRNQYKEKIKEIFADKEGRELLLKISEDYRKQSKKGIRQFADRMPVPGTTLNGKLNELAEIIETNSSKDFNSYNAMNGLVVFADVIRSKPNSFSPSTIDHLMEHGEEWEDKEFFKSLFVQLKTDVEGSKKIKQGPDDKPLLIEPWGGEQFAGVIWSLDKQIALSQEHEFVKLERLLPIGDHLDIK